MPDKLTAEKRNTPHHHTRKGHRVEMFSGDTDCFDLEDIADSLARKVRWGDKFAGAISVASHSVICARFGLYLGYPRDDALHLLLHDAAEAYLVDFPATYKKCVWFQSPAGEMVHVDELEARILDRIYRAFDIEKPNAHVQEVVHSIDLAVRCLEWDAIMKHPAYTRNEDCEAYMAWLVRQPNVVAALQGISPDYRRQITIAISLHAREDYPVRDAADRFRLLYESLRGR